MREIKFRAWLGSEKRMVTPFIEINSDNLPTTYANSASRYPLMQYTGLKDKNGVEIYEGDIVSVQYDFDDKTIHVVEWGGKSYPAFEFNPQLDCECNGFAQYYNDPDTTVEVIGNIHENPELLEPAKC